MSESATTISIRNNLEKTHCKAHPTERIQFYCGCESINICALCVPNHSSHELVVLKDKCAQLTKSAIVDSCGSWCSARFVSHAERGGGFASAEARKGCSDRG